MQQFHSLHTAMVLVLGIASGFAPSEASAQSPSVAVVPARTRTEVILGTVGAGAPDVRSSLIAVLQAELRGMELALIERNPSGELAAWAADATSSERALLAVLLDVRNVQLWRLVVIDTARGRAIARELPGGIQRDAASIEAVATIVISAASALREGLEVASSPVEAVVGPAPSAAPPASGDRAVDSSERRDVAPGLARSWFHGAVGVGVASLSPDVATTQGIAVALGLNWRGSLEARAFGTLFWPAQIRSSFGEFRVNRAFLGAAAGPVLTAGAFAFTPEAGVLVERLRRSDAKPAPEILATESRAIHRVGGLLALRLRHPLIRPLSVQIVTGAAYFGRRVDFSATSAGNTRLVAASPAAVFAQLGLDIATE